MKKLALFISTIVLVSMSGNTFAMEVESTSAERTDTPKMEMKMKKEEARGDIKENRMEASENRKEFRSENKDELMELKESLSDEQKESLEVARDEYKVAREALVTEIKAANAEEKEALMEEMKELGAAHFAEVEEILGVEAAELLAERKGVYEENSELRMENRETRSDYRSERKEYVEKYRQNFVKRLGNSLDSIPTEKLEEVADRIDAFIEKYEANDTISDTKKDAILDQLAALKVIIEEKLESDEEVDDVTEMVETLLAE